MLVALDNCLCDRETGDLRHKNMRIPAELRTWVSAMKRSERGLPVVTNLQNEQNVPRNVAKSFFHELGRQFDAKKDACSCMDQVLSNLPETALAGPPGVLESTLLTRFGRLARLADLPFFKRAGINMGRLVRSPDLADRIRELPLGNRRGIVWASPEKDLVAASKSGATVNNLLDRIGLQEALTYPMYRVTYTADDLEQGPGVPTTLDAGADPRFRSSPEGATHGTTNPVSRRDGGFPEFVHEKLIVSNPRVVFHIRDSSSAA